MAWWAEQTAAVPASFAQNKEYLQCLHVFDEYLQKCSCHARPLRRHCESGATVPFGRAFARARESHCASDTIVSFAWVVQSNYESDAIAPFAESQVSLASVG